MLPGDNGQCRTLNALQLGQWNDQILHGNATVENYPISKLKLPPLRGSRNHPSSSTSILPAMHPVSAPATGAFQNQFPSNLFIGYPNYPGFYPGQPSVLNSTSPFPTGTSINAITNSPTLPISHPTNVTEPSSQVSGASAFHKNSPKQYSSPLPIPAEADPDELLSSYIGWFIKNHGGGERRVAQVHEAHKILQKEFEDLEGVRKMKTEEWRDLDIPIGIGKALSRYVKSFLASTSSSVSIFHTNICLLSLSLIEFITSLAMGRPGP